MLVTLTLRVRQDELVDSVVVDATIYNPDGPHLGVFRRPGNAKHACIRNDTS